MMVETVLESSQDFAGMSGGVPQWKRELLQRRATRPRPTPPPPPPPPPAPPPPDDEELRYGPGIVKRLQSRYLSLALRDAPRRRSSALRRAASLEHLLEAPPPPRPRPTSHHAHLALPPAARRDSIKRARSVDALSRFERRAPEPVPASAAPASARVALESAPHAVPPVPLAAAPSSVPPVPAAPPAAPAAPPAAPTTPPTAPTVPRAARPPRRPQPLLRETERPPVDLVRSALRKFEPSAARRAAPAARVAAVLRGLEPRTSTPEPRARAASPAGPADLSAIEEPEAGPRPVSRAALEGIARAGSSVLFSFPSARAGSHLPPLAATNPVLVARRVGVIRPLPPVEPPPPPPAELDVVDKVAPRLASPPPRDRPAGPALLRADDRERLDKKESPPSAAVEPQPRSPLQEIQSNGPAWERRALETPERGKAEPPPRAETLRLEARPEPLLNGHKEKDEARGAGLPRLNGTGPPRRAGSPPAPAPVPPAWARRGGRPAGAGAGGTSVVFNFSGRAEVPDYIENDGIILRSSRRDKLKAGDPGVVVLAGAGARAGGARGDSDSESDSEGSGAGAGAPEPLAVRFVNDNVLINGRSSLAARRDRQAKLKLQFDDSLTRTFEYPSESSLCEELAPAPDPAPAAAPAPACLAANTHIASAALSGYTPSKTLADAFQLGVTRHHAVAATLPAHPPHAPHAPALADGEPAGAAEGAAGAASWSEARAGHTDLLF